MLTFQMQIITLAGGKAQSWLSNSTNLAAVQYMIPHRRAAHVYVEVGIAAADTHQAVPEITAEA